MVPETQADPWGQRYRVSHLTISKHESEQSSARPLSPEHDGSACASLLTKTRESSSSVCVCVCVHQ